MNRYDIGTLSFDWQADPRYADLSLTEQNRRGFRVVGGDRGDVRFNGYDVDDKGTHLCGVRLLSSLDLTADEAREIATEVIEQAYESIGAECVEHS